MFELIERYGFGRFEENDGTAESVSSDCDVEKPKSKKKQKTNTRQLYSAVSNLDNFDENTAPKRTGKKYYTSLEHGSIFTVNS